MINSARFVVSLSEVGHDDKHTLGEYAAHLGSVRAENFLTPAGFVITPAAYFKFLSENSLETKIAHLIGSINFNKSSSIQDVSRHVKDLITHSYISGELVDEVFRQYEQLSGGEVAVETTIISGDEGQNQLSREYLIDSINGEAALTEVVRSLWASVFDTDLILHRANKDMDHLKSGISTVVKKVPYGQKFGKIYTVDPNPENSHSLLIEVDGDYNIYLIDKKSTKISKQKNPNKQSVFIKNGKSVDRTLTNSELVRLVDLAYEIEKLFKFPIEISWMEANHLFYVLNVKKLNLYGAN